MTPSRNIERLLEIMAALRDPDTGCPWDVEQTFASIIPFTIEETYEVVDAIERDDMEDLREELGDLLLQVVYYAQMAAEIDAFDFGDVTESITAKMIRRHPHVFADETSRSLGMAEGTWKRIKAQEKADDAERRSALGLSPKETQTGLLSDVPTTLPPMAQAVKLQARLATVGFDWETPQAVLPKVREELAELEAELDTGGDKLADEIGDTLFALANLARLAGIDPERAIARTNAKVRRRVSAMEELAPQSLAEADRVELERLWLEAKKRDKRTPL